MQVDVIYAGCVCTDAAVTVPGALVTYAEGRLCISYLEQKAVFDENGALTLGTATFTAGSTNAVLTVSDSAALAGGEEVSVTLPQAVTVAISGATVTPEVKVAEDGTASIDGTVVAGTGAAYEPEEDTSEGAGTGDTDAAASTDTAAADKEAHDTPAGGDAYRIVGSFGGGGHCLCGAADSEKERGNKMKLKGIFTALLAAALVCLLPVTALADAETQQALLLSASQTLVERYNTFTVDVFLTGTPGADILPAAETHIACDNASVEATSAGTAANSKITADGTAVTLSYYGEESAVFDESGRFLLGTITLKAGRSGIATVTASRPVGTVDGLTDVDIPAASGFSGVCSVTIYHYSSSAAEEPVGSPKTGDMGALTYCASAPPAARARRLCGCAGAESADNIA